jgi:hypothetical protein
MDPNIFDLMQDISTLQAQVAVLQANVVWLTRYVWILIVANAGSAIINGVLIKRNNKGNRT